MNPPHGAALRLAPARWNGRRVALTLAVLALMGWALASAGDLREPIRTTAAIWSRPDLLGLFLAGYSAAFALRAVAWRLLLTDAPGVLRLFGFLQAALLANHLFPTKVGEVVRVGLLARSGVPLPAAASSTLLARLLDLGSLCLLALAWTPLAGGSSDRLAAALVLPFLLLVAAGAGFGALVSGGLEGLWARCPRRVATFAREVEVALRTISPSRGLGALAITLPSWILEAVALWAVAQAAGIALALPLAITATAFTIAFQGFQVTPGGIGLYEASLTGILTLHGVEPSTALALAVATHALKFAYSYVVGLLCLGAEAVYDTAGLGRGRARAALAALAARVDPAFALALLAALAVTVASAAGATTVLRSGPAAGLSSDSFAAGAAGLVLGALAALPLVVLGRSHHLPRSLLPLMIAPAVLFAVFFGLPGPLALLTAVLLVGLAAASCRPHLPAVLWGLLLSQVILAGAAQPVAVFLFGAGCAVAVLLTRQWWTARHPLPPPSVLPAGATLAVIIPVHDEADAIGPVVSAASGGPRSALEQKGFAVQVIVVDDGSTDGSGAIARAAGADRVLRHPVRQGLGAALRSGLATARSEGASAAVYLDGDGEYDPGDLLDVIRPVLAGKADYVLGVRFPGAGRVMRPARLYGNRGFTGLLRLLTGVPLHDGQTGFRAFGPRALAVAEIIHDYNYAQVLTLDLLRKRLRLAEVPIHYRTRATGHSFIRYPEYARRVLPAIARELLAP